MDERHPIHVTLRALPRTPSFRSELVAQLARGVFAELSQRKRPVQRRLDGAGGRDSGGGRDGGGDRDDDGAREATEAATSRPPRKDRTWRRLPRATDRAASRFHVVHYSLQDDHVHLLVEAADQEALSCGMRRLVIRLAKRINDVVRRARHGRVWAGRYHRHDLTSPSEVRRALVYVLQNARKHGHTRPGRLDPFSSALSFRGWHRFASTESEDEPVRPWTWLLETGWSRAGPRGGLRLNELPKPSPQRPRRAPRRSAHA